MNKVKHSSNLIISLSLIFEEHFILDKLHASIKKEMKLYVYWLLEGITDLSKLVL